MHITDIEGCIRVIWDTENQNYFTRRVNYMGKEINVASSTIRETSSECMGNHIVILHLRVADRQIG